MGACTFCVPKGRCRAGRRREARARSLAGIYWDVTEARENERELALERHRMNFLMENVPDKIYFQRHQRPLRAHQ